ncbi:MULTISPECIES: hypothetical protein [unclassified Bradyrhizobium]|uniref:hypothetical protein n=1 Tax=unclassified Bradyrhizobium TaxID=2631580 RepID=UPI00339AA25D
MITAKGNIRHGCAKLTAFGNDPGTMLTMRDKLTEAGGFQQRVANAGMHGPPRGSSRSLRPAMVSPPVSARALDVDYAVTHVLALHHHVWRPFGSSDGSPSDIDLDGIITGDIRQTVETLDRCVGWHRRRRLVDAVGRRPLGQAYHPPAPGQHRVLQRGIRPRVVQLRLGRQPS